MYSRTRSGTSPAIDPPALRRRRMAVDDTSAVFRSIKKIIVLGPAGASGGAEVIRKASAGSR